MTDEARAARRAYKRQWEKKNPDKVKAYKKKWAAKNPDKIRAQQERYWSRRAAEQEPPEDGGGTA